MISLYYFVSNFQENTPNILVKKSRNIQLSDPEGQLVMNRIDKLKLSKSKVFPKEKVNLFFKNFEFYIETVTQELDITNRPATLGIYGKIPVLNKNYTIGDWLFTVCNETEEFSKSIDRTIYDFQLHTIKNQLFDLYLKAKLKRQIFLWFKYSIILISPIIIAWRISLFSKTTNIIMSGLLISISNGLLIILNKED